MCSVKTWTNVEYGIICKQLGLTAGSALPTADRGYMPQEKYHLLTNVTCSGEEKMIKDCPHDPWHVVQGNCPYKPILVRCEGEYVLYIRNLHYHRRFSTYVILL